MRCQYAPASSHGRSSPDNPHDPLAVAIFTASGTCVGFLGRDRAAWIAPKIDRGFPVNAIVERVKGLHLEGATLGLVMRVNMDGEEPALPDGGEALRQVA